jgi:hypothetical protein
MGLVSRVEPPGPEMVEANEDCMPMLQKVGWLKFLLSFHGHNLKIARDFTQTFNGQVTKIGDI